jgi:hypothetical protein
VGYVLRALALATPPRENPGADKKHSNGSGKEGSRRSHMLSLKCDLEIAVLELLLANLSLFPLGCPLFRSGTPRQSSKVTVNELYE